MAKKIFIIDDDAILRLIIKKMVLKIDNSLSCHQCENGEVGLKELELIKNSEDRVIVLLDINMPILDGWGFLDRLEECNAYNIKLLDLYILSSSTDESDKLKASQYKVVKKFFHKPLNNVDLIEVLKGGLPIQKAG